MLSFVAKIPISPLHPQPRLPAMYFFVCVDFYVCIGSRSAFIYIVEIDRHLLFSAYAALCTHGESDYAKVDIPFMLYQVCHYYLQR